MLKSVKGSGAVEYSILIALVSLIALMTVASLSAKQNNLQTVSFETKEGETIAEKSQTTSPKP
jgi:Flp pilus assembly pilin Flp